MSPRRDLDELRRRRMRAANLFEQGATQADVARRLEVSRTSVMRWYRAWRARGESGLQGARRAGRRRRLTQRQIEQLERELLRGPRAHGYDTELWTLPRLAQVIERMTGVGYHPGHVWRVIHQLGWVSQKPALRARERDEDAIRGWIKTTHPQATKTPRAGTPPSPSSSNAASRSGPPSAGPGRSEGKPPS